MGQFASLGICVANDQLTPQPMIIPKQAQATDASALSHGDMAHATSTPNEMPPTRSGKHLSAAFSARSHERTGKRPHQDQGDDQHRPHDQRDALAAHHPTSIRSIDPRGAHLT
jgi:hypothetical protein